MKFEMLINNAIIIIINKDMEKEEYGLFYDRYTDRFGLSCQNVILSEESLWI